MSRIELEENSLDAVVGGSIVISPDHTTCGYNCNNQYKVNDYSAMKAYYKEHKSSMNEPEMLKNMLSLGYISAM